MKLIDANKVIERAVKNNRLKKDEKSAIIKAVIEEPVAVNLTKLMIKVAKLKTIPGEELEPYVSMKEVMQILKEAQKSERNRSN